jgi:hypothetical protein
MWKNVCYYLLVLQTNTRFLYTNFILLLWSTDGSGEGTACFILGSDMMGMVSVSSAGKVCSLTCKGFYHLPLTFTDRRVMINKSVHWVSSTLLFIGGAHIGARALLDKTLIWFGYITHLSRWGGGGYFTRWNAFYLPSPRLEEGDSMYPKSQIHTIMTEFYACKADTRLLSW